MFLSQISDSIGSRRLIKFRRGAGSYILPYKIRQIKASEEGDYERINYFCERYMVLFVTLLMKLGSICVGRKIMRTTGIQAVYIRDRLL